MATVDWTKLVDDESEDEQHFSVVQGAGQAPAQQAGSSTDGLPAGTDSLDPETSVRTVVKYEKMTQDEIDANGGKYNTRKITYKYKVERKKILQCVARRKHLKKFGLAVNDPPGPNYQTTSIKDEVEIQYSKDVATPLKASKEEPILKFTCSHCGLDHQTTTCPSLNPTASQVVSPTTGFAAASSKYVAPGLRGSSGAQPPPTEARSSGQPEEPTIRVTNLPSETREQDLRELFGVYGHITRVFVPRDPTTREAKGYAFITFDTMHPARLSAKLMNNYNYASMALNVELVQKPRNPRP